MKVRAVVVNALLIALGAAGWGSRPEPTRISRIQGASHLSPLLGRRVTTEGVVTALVESGFYLQDPAGDGDRATSDAIFAETQPRGAVGVGDRVRIVGTVAESASDGPPTGLRITRLTRTSALEVLSRENPLPRPVVIGAGGLSIPRTWVIAPAELPVDLRDSVQVRANRFTPDTDVVDFFEALEGMLVTLRGPVALSPTESRGPGRSDFFAHPDAGPGTEDRHLRTAAGGMLLHSGRDNLGDQNPDRLRIAFHPMLYRERAPILAVGDRIGDITGVMDYAYGAFQVSPIVPIAVTARSGWVRQVTAIESSRTRLTIATYNVLNLSADSADDLQRTRLASQIVWALRAPDILALQEIQDSSGERDDGVVDARPTLRALARAVIAAGGPGYAYLDVPPVDKRPGGAPGGNIRNAFFYDSARVKLVSYRSLTPTVLAAAGAPNPAAFTESRDPLEAVFEFSGRRITAINNHLTSRYGSTPVFGAVQPWVQAGEAEREAQVRALRAYMSHLVEVDSGAQVVVLGDMNTFETSDDLAIILPGAPPLLTDLIARVAQPERYSYIFEGNSQVLDHIFVTRNLAAAAMADVVHLNVDFPSERPASDHDPVVAGFRW
jgi:predicted extracellular nuclease